MTRDEQTHRLCLRQSNPMVLRALQVILVDDMMFTCVQLSNQLDRVFEIYSLAEKRCHYAARDV